MPRFLDRRRADALIGAIVVMLLAAVATIAVKAALGAYADEYTIRATTTRTGFGLDEASAVKVRGISIGTVDDVRLLDDGTVELTMAIRDGIDVPAASTASIEPVSVFGPKFVDLVPGPTEESGPFLADGDSLGAIVEPSELLETLDAVSDLLDVVDPTRVGLILTELSRGLDGTGQQLGETLDATGELTDRLNRVRPQLERLLTDASLLSQTLAARSGDITSLGEDLRPLLTLIADQEDPLAELLVQASELAVRLEDVVDTSSAELDGVLIGLEGGASVLAEHIVLISDFVDGLDGVSDLLSTGLFSWERLPGEWGAIGHGFIDFDPCMIASLDPCPTGGA